MRFVDERMEKKNDRYRIESLRGEWAVRIHHFIIAAKDLKKKSAMPKRPEWRPRVARKTHRICEIALDIYVAARGDGN